MLKESSTTTTTDELLQNTKPTNWIKMVIIFIALFSALAFVGLIILICEIFNKFKRKNILKKSYNKKLLRSQSLISILADDNVPSTTPLLNKNLKRHTESLDIQNAKAEIRGYVNNVVNEIKPNLVETMIKNDHIDAKCVINYDLTKKKLYFNIHKLQNLSNNDYTNVYVLVVKLDKVLETTNFLNNNIGVNEVVTTFKTTSNFVNYIESYTKKGPQVSLGRYEEQKYNFRFMIPLNVDETSRKFRICCKIFASTHPSGPFKLCGQLCYYEKDIFMNYIHKNSKENDCVII